MKVRFWGTRGSQASPGPDTARYGGNTSCVQVDIVADSVLALDAGTGIRRLSGEVTAATRRVDILLTHLHMDHIQGLGFFSPLHLPGLDVHIWGPGSTTMGLARRLARYLSPPLFPVRLRDLGCNLSLHDVPLGSFEVPGATVTTDLVFHPGPTVGYRIEHDGRVLTYLPDHEPRLGSHRFAEDPAWMSGFALADRADVLIHDAQYDADEYVERAGWGHSAVGDAVAFARASGVRRLVLFHHDPAHDDDAVDALTESARAAAGPGLDVLTAREGDTVEV